MLYKQGLTFIILFLLFLYGIQVNAQTTHGDLLLVTASDTGIESLPHAEVRKLFLGAPMVLNEMRLRPVLNTSDPLIMEVFLQKIIFMSRREYERQLVSRVFRLGGQRPQSFDNTDELVKELLATPGSLSYMWSEQLLRYPGLKSLGVLWAESAD